MEADQTSTSLFSQANAAFVAEDYFQAEELYTKAITGDRNRADYFVNRSHTYQKLEKYKEAKEDAEEAAKLDKSEPKAYLRQGVACFHLGEYEEALEAFQKGLEVGGGDSGLRQWLTWTNEKLDKLKIKENVESNVSSKADAIDSKSGSTVTANPPVPPPIKHDWYQTESHVCVTVLIKNLDPKEVSVHFGGEGASETQEVTVEAKLPDGRDYRLPLQLSYPVIPTQSTYNVLKTKVEVRMKKCDGIRWTQLEGEVPANIKQIAVLSSACGNQPVYPSSAPKKKDWDRIEVEIKKEEAEEKPEGEAALNQLFQKIYSEGSEEVRRAMNKSFQESGGTVLSTNWNEVAKEKLAVKPPEGMEFKKWD